MDPRTNTVLYSKNENGKVYPASTTKILTAIIVLENCNLNDVVTASYTSVAGIPEGYSTSDIQVGEQLTVKQLLELLIVHSANDAANVLAEFVGGSIDNFVAMMNAKLHNLNLTNSHFTNPYGLHNEEHYTTAYDLAHIMKYCLKNSSFRQLASRSSCEVPATNLHGPRNYNSTNELLIAESPNYYPFLITGKTGFTSQAKECLVSSAYKDNLELIGVILGSDNRFADTRSLYEYGYSHYLVQIENNANAPTEEDASNINQDTNVPTEDDTSNINPDANVPIEDNTSYNNEEPKSFLYTMYSIIIIILVVLIVLLIYYVILLFKENKNNL